MESARPSMPPIPRGARYGTRSTTGAKVHTPVRRWRINGAGSAGAGAVQRDGAHPRSRETAPGADARVSPDSLGQSPPPRGGGGGGGGEPAAAPPDTIGWEMSHSLVSFDQVLCIA